MPQSEEAEEYLLSCCFIDGRDVVSLCIEAKLSEESLYDPRRRIIFGKLLDLHNRNLPIDVSIVAEELKTSHQLDAVGGFAYLAHVSRLVPTTAQAGYFIAKVRENQLLRDLISAATAVTEDCYNFSGDIDGFVDGVEKRLFTVTQRRAADRAVTVKGPVAEAMKVLGKMIEKKGELTGIPSGFVDLDRLTFGFQRSDMLVLAARPSMGKTALALNFAEAAVMPMRGAPAPTLIFSLEMGAAQLALRLICSRARVNLKLLRDGLISRNGAEQNRLLEVSEAFASAPLFIDDSSSLSIMQLRAKARRVASRHKLGFIIVDYLQLLSPTDPRIPREQQVSEASRGLKALAKELDVPVLVLSQLNRASERDNRTPRLSDLRESGAIEQDADVVLMLARPKDADEKFQVAADQAELIVAKQRNGPVGEVRLTFLREITRFENWTAS